MKWLPVLLVLISGCAGGSGGETTTPSLTSTEGLPAPTGGLVPPRTSSTTTGPTTTTTVPAYMVAAAWMNESLMPFFDTYNDEFADPFSEHFDAGDFNQARLDCVAVRPLVDGWEEELGTPPDQAMEALTEDAFRQLRSTLNDCIEAETLGDFRDVAYRLSDVTDGFLRIREAIGDIGP